MQNEILINASPGETRVAILEHNQFVEFHLERAKSRGVVGDVVLGRVNRVLPGMQAAFVDIGLEKAAFLYAGDYVEAAHSIMQLAKPDVFVIASGKSYSVEYFAKKCFQYVGLNYKNYLRVNKKLLRKSKTTTLIGDTKKAKKALNFKVKTNLNKLISIMMSNDLEIEAKEI